ncbi:MAG: sigma-54-dependent Fis family transcriptional regulator [Calditrichaeota bacterium]|nr:sigma-54-dependent Fis family transcriptional regulator [Calditrichota bacterium]MCB9473374.1 sigma-54-dependent Fis family transcriptional regulator [Candidatus Delongbacteria bacterium]
MMTHSDSSPDTHDPSLEDDGLRGRVLMIDDDPSICEAIRSLLSPYAIRFRSCLDLAHGHRECTEWKPDALILDLDFRGQQESGLDLLARLRAEGLDVPVLIFTSEVSVQNFQQAIRHGIFNFLAKPIRRNPFLIALRGALENQRLKRERIFRPTDDPVLGISSPMLELKARLRNIAPWESPVLITGESGTGKELVCRELQRLGPRADKPFRVLNCASLRAETIRDELFGHERGAFTGADHKRPGMADEADGGMLFLDEIGLLPIETQGVLLRFLQEGEIHALGSNQVRRVDVQVIAATNEDLRARVQEGEFRQDLYERISILQLHCPPLRERGRDIRLLAEAFLYQELSKRSLPFRPISEDVLQFLETRLWPGNVRQLHNTVLNLIVHYYHQEGQMGSPAELMALIPALSQSNDHTASSLVSVDPLSVLVPDIMPYIEAKRVFTRAYFHKAVDALNGNITAAAKALDVNPSTIHRAFMNY